MAGRPSKRQIKYNKELQALWASYNSEMEQYSFRVITLLKEASEEITKKLTTLYPASWERAQLAEINVLIKEVLDKFRGEYNTVMVQALNSSAEAGVNSVASLMKNNLDVTLIAQLEQANIFLPVVMDNSIRASLGISSTLIKEVTEQTAREINNKIVLGLLQNKPVYQVIDDISGTLGGNKLGFTTLNSRSWAIYRTETSRMYNNATNLQMNRTKQIIPQAQKQWNHGVMIGLGQTPRPGHQALDGVTLLYEESFQNPVTFDMLRFPHDPLAPASEVVNCGCALSMVMPDNTFLRDNTLVSV